MLLTSILSLSYNIFYHTKEKLHHFTHNEIVACECFYFDKAKILSSGKELNLSQMTNLDSSKLKGFAEDNFKFDEYGRKLSKRVENTGEKGENC